jgi:hypothetical protein
MDTYLLSSLASFFFLALCMCSKLWAIFHVQPVCHKAALSGQLGNKAPARYRRVGVVLREAPEEVMLKHHIRNIKPETGCNE